MITKILVKVDFSRATKPSHLAIKPKCFNGNLCLKILDRTAKAFS